MEAVLRNTLSEGDKIIVINAGVFGERWVKIAKKLGLNVVELIAPAGQSVPLDVISLALKEHKDAKALALQLTETSTTVNHPVGAIGKMLKDVAPEMLYIVDAVSGLATAPLSIKDHHIDVIAAGSQKALMLPPGLSMLMMSTKAWDEVRKKKSDSFYFDLLAERAAHEQGTSAWTPAMNIILGLNESFRMIREEGLANVYARHSLLAQATRSGLNDLGFTLLTENYPSPAVTGAYPPSGVDAEQLRSDILAQSGVRIAGGQDKLKGKIIRIGHMGYVNEFDIVTALSAIELALVRRGHSLAIGRGVSAALKSVAAGALLP